MTSTSSKKLDKNLFLFCPVTESFPPIVLVEIKPLIKFRERNNKKVHRIMLLNNKNLKRKP